MQERRSFGESTKNCEGLTWIVKVVQAQMADDDQMGRMTNTQRNGSILMMILIADD